MKSPIIPRSSRRLSQLDSSESEQEEDSSSWSDEDGEDAPLNDPVWTAVDKEWTKACLNKNVFFRWSTAFNSKNKFKGIVTEYRSRIDSQKGGERIDFLVIKTYGYSEDRYRMGKDIRELYVLPNKTSLMMGGSEEEIKARAVSKWHWRDGWTNCGNNDLTGESTQADTPLVEPVVVKPPAIKQGERVNKKQHVISKPKKSHRKNSTEPSPIKPVQVIERIIRHGSVRTYHSGESARFSFWSN